MKNDFASLFYTDLEGEEEKMWFWKMKAKSFMNSFKTLKKEKKSIFYDFLQ